MEFDEVFLHQGTVDFRKSINGLSEIVQNDLAFNLFGKYLFVFLCKNRKKIKILYWDETGFALWYKLLEKDRFPWPKVGEKRSSSVLSNYHDSFPGLTCGEFNHIKIKF